MTIIGIKKKNPPVQSKNFLSEGFKPFFFGAVLHSIIVMLFWAALYSGVSSISHIGIMQWHAHEMVYGYSMAVIAGFLLTAVTNWTGVKTISGIKLAALFFLWAAARILFSLNGDLFAIAGIFDILFDVLLLAAVSYPIIKVRDFRQAGVLAKVLLLTLGNSLFYYGMNTNNYKMMSIGLYGGLYLIVGLILTIGSRVIPSFIQSGIKEDIDIKNPRWASRISLALFFIFFINELFIALPVIRAISAGALFILTTYRLSIWHAPGIWGKPLLWSLFLAIVFIDLGFLFFAVSAFFPVSLFIALHAFAAGGIGLSTIGMMARVILGHTGRKISTPPSYTGLIFAILTASIFFRVIAPAIFVNNYFVWILTAQLLWSLSFLLFFIRYCFKPLFSAPN